MKQTVECYWYYNCWVCVMVCWTNFNY